MVIYIENVLINNFIINLTLLDFSVRVLRQKTKLKRLLFCSFLGGVASLVLPVLEGSKAILLIKILIGLLMTFIATKDDFFSSVKLFFVFLFAVIFLSGITYLIDEAAFYGNYKAVKMLKEYGFLVAVVIYAVSVLTLKAVIRTESVNKSTYECMIKVEDKAYKVNGFLDTGNNVYLGFCPIAVLSKKVGEKIKADLIKSGRDIKTQKVKISTVFNDSELEVILNAKIYVLKGDKPHIYSNVGLAFSDKSLCQDVILHASFI